MTSCPNCGKPVDSLRAPAVGVREGKVVSYCSKECAIAAESKPTASTKLVPTKIVRLPSNAETPMTPATGVVVPASMPDSAPVIEIIRETSEPAAKQPRKQREDNSSVQIADTGHIDDYITPDSGGRRGMWIAVAVLVLALAGGIAFAIGAFDKLLGRGDDTSAPPVRTSDAAVTQAAPPDATPAVSVDAAVARAQQVLRTQLESESPRVQRVAASALARTGDKAAIEVLATALAKESGHVAKVDLAYALARAGDARGVDALVSAGKAPGRESKHEAGRRLALLGDKRAIDVLGPSLQYPQFRLGVAEQLAYLAEPRALKVLDDVRADPKSLPDEKARAAIALGHAKRSDITPVLHELLADDRNNAFAAIALASMKDEAARPVLVKQLTIPSLRAQAARALRRLNPDANLAPLLPPLVAALDSQKDTEQVGIAEAILLLVGPPAWSERE